MELQDSTDHITHKEVKGWAGLEVATASRHCCYDCQKAQTVLVTCFSGETMDPQVMVDHSARKDATP